MLDECVDRRLTRDLRDHHVATVPRLGWAGMRNGALLKRASAEGFDAFVTVDRNVSFQQPVQTYRTAVVVPRATSNRWEDLHPLADQLLRALQEVKPGTVTVIP